MYIVIASANSCAFADVLLMFLKQILGVSGCSPQNENTEKRCMLSCLSQFDNRKWGSPIELVFEL